jgi:D-3-phosphoglycerate dehydrogenase
MAYDPYVSPERAASLGVRLGSLEAVLQEADFISVHTPLTPQTRGMIGADELALLKPTAYIVNCARGGIIDEAALADAIENGVLAGAALDVFEMEPATDNPLVGLDNVLATPHLGASTAEAQESVALDVAQAVVDVLDGRIPATPVNVPYLPPQAADFLQPLIDLAHRMGSFYIQWRGQISNTVELIYEGAVCDYDTRVLTAAFLAGLLTPATSEPVNIVNSLHVARRQGLSFSEMSRGPQDDRRASTIQARFHNGEQGYCITGTIHEDEPHLVSVDGHHLDCVLAGCMLVDLHHDRPGIVGGMGTVLGEAGINISFVQMSRVRRGGPQIMILGLDEEVAPELLPRLERVPNVQRVRMVCLPPLEEGEAEGL